MKEIIHRLNEATKYYDMGEPIMSDREWDSIYYSLCALESETQTILPDSPTNSIYFEVRDSLPKIKHEHQMLSLQKTKEISEIKNFLGDVSWIAMAKMDGLTCSLTYENGLLTRAETRGNGIEGEDILHNAKANLTIPNKIDYKDRVVIDGEIICTYDNFERYKDVYKNPRNLAAGSIRLLNSKDSRDRLLTFVAWDVIEPFKDAPNELKAQFDRCSFYGFTTVPRSYGGTIEEAIDDIVNASKYFNYPIDGIVFKFNDLTLRDSLGYTAHHFNNAIAYKFFDELYDTKLKDIEWTMGRTGVLTPVAVFEPVDADGSIVERASLHNLSVMEELLSIPFKSQHIKIFKANMIIPQIYEAEKPADKPQSIIELPHQCPVCGGEVKIVDNDGVKNIICVNPNCQGKLINRLDHFFGKKGLDSKGISKFTFEKLIDWEWVSSIIDVYDLEKYAIEWTKKPGFGVKSVNKILNSIKESSNNVNWERFLCAIGIPLIGETVSKDLGKVFKSWDEFRTAVDNKYEFYNLPNFGLEKHNAIMKFNYEEADKLAKDFVKFAEPASTIAKTETANNLEGKTFVITGKLIHYKNRSELQNEIEKRGGKVTGSVSKNTDYLINNDNTSTSSKNLTAKKLNVPIITEDELSNLFDF